VASPRSRRTRILPKTFLLHDCGGIFVPSSDTEIGAGAHRRVDRPSAAKPEVATNGNEAKPASVEKLEETETDPDRPKSIRSLALTSTSLGLTATLDLTEINGNSAVPIEYRKGKPRRAHANDKPIDEMMEQPQLFPVPEPWPTDRAQLGLQVLLLEEAGYTVPEAYLYYATEKLKLRVEVNDTLREYAKSVLAAAKLAAEGPRPPPLLKAIDRVRLENAVREILNLKEDQLLIVDMGGNEEAARESSSFLGVGIPHRETGTLVI